MDEKEKEKVYNAIQVPTNYSLAIETPEEKVISQEQALAEILNQLKEIKKLLG